MDRSSISRWKNEVGKVYNENNELNGHFRLYFPNKDFMFIFYVNIYNKV